MLVGGTKPTLGINAIQPGPSKEKQVVDCQKLSDIKDFGPNLIIMSCFLFSAEAGQD